MKHLLLATVTTMLLTFPSLAACPATVPGDSAEAIRNNQDRLICLQRELAADAAQRALDLKLRMLEADQQRLEIERRLQTVEPFQPPVL